MRLWDGVHPRDAEIAGNIAANRPNLSFRAPNVQDAREEEDTQMESPNTAASDSAEGHEDSDDNDEINSEEEAEIIRRFIGKVKESRREHREEEINKVLEHTEMIETVGFRRWELWRENTGRSPVYKWGWQENMTWVKRR